MSRRKIYFEDSYLTISDEQNPGNENAVVTTSVENITDLIQAGLTTNLYLQVADVAGAIDQIFKDYTVVKAGGGLVMNAAGKVLLIFRRKHWDLPKGKLDDGETIAACALREVREETGLKSISLVSLYKVSRHVYQYHNENILKETHWFLMSHQGDEDLHVQTEEDIEKAEWVAMEDLPAYRENMYPLIWDVLQNGK